MIEYIKQDLTRLRNGLIVHGCNCRGVMGSGVAAALRRKWPQIFPPYKKACDEKGGLLLGTAQFVCVEQLEFSEIHIGNLFTQLTYGRDVGWKYASTDAIFSALVASIVYAQTRGGLPLYMPKIGCGLGGLNWEKEVLPIVERLEVTSGDAFRIFVCDI